jgi:TRAP-type mannitol/chloroaromatic compound transport system substrate-binding protein
MLMRKSVLTFVWAALGAALTFAGVTTSADAQDKVRWKMQSAFGSQLTHLGPSGVRFSKDIESTSRER